MSVCVGSESNLLHIDRVVIAGYDCTSSALYWVVWVVAIGIQVLRNLVWTKNSQATRMALQSKCGSPERDRLTKQILLFTVVSFMLYIFSFLLILGANLGFMLAVLIGNVLGTWYGMSHQAADSGQMRQLEEMTELMSDYNTTGVSDEKELKDLKEFREQLLLFLNTSEEYTQVLANKKALKF